MTVKSTNYFIKDNVEKVFTDANKHFKEHLKVNTLEIYNQSVNDEHLEECTDIRNNYMYVYSDSDYDYFKCINHRQYIKVTSN
tara:strand:- start:382 stop:630 length:249 start_codon:yes stop_codon:yes gene_type:complete